MTLTFPPAENKCGSTQHRALTVGKDTDNEDLCLFRKLLNHCRGVFLMHFLTAHLKSCFVKMTMRICKMIINLVG